MNTHRTADQIALCATLDDELQNRMEKALLKARIDYLLQCDKKNAQEKSKKVVFYIEQRELERARSIAASMINDDKLIEIYS